MSNEIIVVIGNIKYSIPEDKIDAVKAIVEAVSDGACNADQATGD